MLTYLADTRAMLHGISFFAFYFVSYLCAKRLEAECPIPSRAQVTALLFCVCLVLSAACFVTPLTGEAVSALVVLVGLLAHIARSFRSSSIRALAICLAMSWGWELIIQPLVTVYGAPARGYIQWCQVSADLVGIVLGVCVCWSLRFRAPASRVGC
ncbi:hypothetical protein LCGC14_0282880 [marine sediment metagenome]|uniref:Uncharacterized protein n=1 Tax=marine sediment metagenome TaxID=412755 RepID=A0A0F9U0L8_9ZZZZ